MKPRLRIYKEKYLRWEGRGWWVEMAPATLPARTFGELGWDQLPRVQEFCRRLFGNKVPPHFFGVGAWMKEPPSAEEIHQWADELGIEVDCVWADPEPDWD